MIQSIDDILEIAQKGLALHYTEVDKLAAEVLRLRAALSQIAETEQSHCYADIHSSEVNETVQARFDLRKCGDLARAALNLNPETRSI